ncbi:MAG: GntR family transcriptional regulator [Rubrivivax sp.]|nr:MAG: GntR family transcriptional regulator [Rubrivivax sp.]
MKSNQLVALPVTPLHGQIKHHLREKILDGSYSAGGQMPSESELCSAFSASRITVRQALGDLQKEGLIYKVHGKGSFVSRPKAFQNVSTLQGFAESMSAMGHEVLNQLKSLRFVAADGDVAKRLQVPVGTTVTEIRRVRLLNREPVSLELTWVSEVLGRRLAQADLLTRDIFLILENDCGVRLGHADIAIDAVLADEDIAQALAMEVGLPVLRIERLTHDVQGRPVDHEFLYFRGDAFQYRLRSERQPVAKE